MVSRYMPHMAAGPPRMAIHSPASFSTRKWAPAGVVCGGEWWQWKAVGGCAAAASGPVQQWWGGVGSTH
jgi:hypothetical protein